MPTSNPSSLRPDELQWEKRVYARFTKLTRVDLPARMERLAPRLAAGLRALPEVTDGASLDRWFEGYGQLRLDPETRTERGTLPGARGDAQTVWIDLDVLNAQLVGGLAGRCPGVIHPLFEIFRETG